MVQSSNMGLYSAAASQVGVNNWYVACVAPVRQGMPIQCSSQGTSRAQCRVSGNNVNTNLVTYLYDPSTALRITISVEFVAEPVA